MTWTTQTNHQPTHTPTPTPTDLDRQLHLGGLALVPPRAGDDRRVGRLREEPAALVREPRERDLPLEQSVKKNYQSNNYPTGQKCTGLTQKCAGIKISAFTHENMDCRYQQAVLEQYTATGQVPSAQKCGASLIGQTPCTMLSLPPSPSLPLSLSLSRARARASALVSSASGCESMRIHTRWAGFDQCYGPDGV
jgi:hypothetical protein